MKFIKEVSENSENATDKMYLVPNSIRHVLETISSFEMPGRSIDNFICERKIFDNCEFSKIFIQDLSHGNIRMQKPCTSEDIQEACSKVLEYIKSNYKGQLEVL